MGNLIKGECPPTVGDFNEKCYYWPEDHDNFFNGPRMGADVCPESNGEETCTKILNAKAQGGGSGSQAGSTIRGWKEGEFSSGPVGFGVGYYGADQVVDGETLRRWSGIGANAAFSASPFIWGIANLTLSVDGNLGFGDGIEANGGVGPAFSIGLPAIVRGWGAFKARGIAASGTEEREAAAGWGLNPEAGLSVFFLDFRWVFPAVTGGETRQGNSFFAGVSLGLP
ncbi:MAG: hypothetical protein HYW02_01555 [Deltaproteobacteria bacterium]|nr:hypothetical protein [Deltaproteobacteria bacterium]MBI2500165.1 hypothetical protein [Deltaproteobacteria bacterium]